MSRKWSAPCSHIPDVLYCAVVGVSDPVWQQRIIAVVECIQGKNITLKALQDHCRNFIASYKIPRGLVVASFKLTENGKIDYRWAQQLATADAILQEVAVEPCLEAVHTSQEMP